MMHTYHYSKDMVFSGVFDVCFKTKKVKYERFIQFTKFKDLIYIEIKNAKGNARSIIIPFDDLLKNTYLKTYYDLSLQLTTHKNLVVEVEWTEYNRRSFNYEKKTSWYINTAYFNEDFYTAIRTIETDDYRCPYHINPNDLRNMDVSSVKDIERFFGVLNVRFEYEERRGFKDILEYTNLMLEYNVASIEKELEKISASQEDNKNIMVLLELNSKKEMNTDLFAILYGLVVSKEGQKKYVPVY
jgi:hypothetical protein